MDSQELHSSGAEKEGGVGTQRKSPGRQARSSILCQVEGCDTELVDAKPYLRRYKICQAHYSQSSIHINGTAQRFCQQCGRFHPVGCFDGKKKSCRERLELHNERRRSGGPARPKARPRRSRAAAAQAVEDSAQEGVVSASGTAAAPEASMPDVEQEASSSSGQQSDAAPDLTPDALFRTDTAGSATAQLAQRLAQQSLLAEVSLLGGSHSSGGEAEDGDARPGSPSLTAILETGEVGLEQELGEGCWGEMMAGPEEAEWQCQLQQPDDWDDMLEQQAEQQQQLLPAALGSPSWEMPPDAGTAGQGPGGMGGGASLPVPSVAHWLAMEEEEQQEVAAMATDASAAEETCSLAAGLGSAGPHVSTPVQQAGPTSSTHYCSLGAAVNATVAAPPFGTAAMSYLAAAASVLAAAKAAEAATAPAAATSHTAPPAVPAGSRREEGLPQESCSVWAACRATGMAGAPEPQSRPCLTGTPIVAMPVQQQAQQQAQQQCQQWPYMGPAPGFYMDASGTIRLGIPGPSTAVYH